jgi:putative DNA primase/helicase
MRGDFFTYSPQFTLVIATNHLPQLRAAGGMRRRLQITPFRHRPAVPDPDLPEKLKAEWPGILAWMIAGAIRWWGDGGGLRPSPAVIAATEEYFDRESPIRLWLDERCELDRAAEATSRELYANFASWAAKNGERALNRKQFAQRLAEAGLVAAKMGANATRVFRGVRLSGGTRGLDL